jgi:hypothetical protein
MGRAAACMIGEVHVRFWWENLRPLGRPRRRCKNNSTMDLQEMVWGHRLDSSGSGQGEVAGCSQYDNEITVPLNVRGIS